MSEREDIRVWWFSILSEIADLDLQRRKWLDPTNTDNPHWSYIEFKCSYPTQEQISDGPKKGYVSLQEAEAFTNFRRILVAHKSPTGNDWDNEAVLNDPAWHSVVRAAQKTMQDLASLPQP